MIIQPGGAEGLGFVIPLTKIDAAKRLVYGVAAVEEPDLSKEVFDYETSKPNIEKWSKQFELATNGLSKGNLRAMHGKHAAGKFNEIAFDDTGKMVKVCAHVVDDNDWRKVETGVYTGFSVGGGYVKKWADPNLPGHTRYTADVREISLVDNPCMPSARFAELVKADGMVTQIPLIGRPRTFAEIWAERPKPAPTFAELWAARRGG